MLNGKRILGIIPARGGSKGVPRKNIREVAGKPLIAWTIEEARKSKYIDRLILSSDDKEIIQVANEYDCEVPFVRPKKLARDDTPGIDPVLHAIETLHGFDYIVLLQPTSPLRRVDDIDGCIEKCLRNLYDYCVTVNEADKSPYWMYAIENDKMVAVLSQDKIINRRQESPKVYVLNGAIYIAKTEKLVESKTFLTNETVPYIMPKERSLDIDTEFDLKIVEILLNNPLKNVSEF
ncbi:acylneuraminate cytidylyltransferase family protein [Tepidibacillus infernus]|uniref:acylneuraminate cytidylyltransferase family protein n=1 Tax=Tepidibacillus TaxID=1494427 RepID=UPI0008537A5E|nr:acylneuraminate cytidylyltransferase family protein [Tepidibacillus sp. HK-1]GBF10550.1 CMP-N,N'-diacetyllegionaminic acid synthase [Tepidibacillus sp. HK-1]